MSDQFDYNGLNGLVARYGQTPVQEAIIIAKRAAGRYPPPYYTGDVDFAPHKWVVAAILEAAERPRYAN